MIQKSERSEASTGKGNILVNIGEHRKDWLMNVTQLSNSSQAEVIRVLLDQAATEDPESFVLKMEKFKIKMRLRDLESREEAIKKEKEELMRSVEKTGDGVGRG